MGDRVTNGSLCPTNDYKNNRINFINITLILLGSHILQSTEQMRRK